MSLKLLVASFNLDVVKLSLACSMLLFSACATASDEEKLRTEQAEVYSEMAQVVADNSCSSAADCGILAVGSMACGGPASYMAYSRSIGEGKIAELKALADRTEQLDKKINEKSQMMSPCVYHSAPSLVCENNQCATVYDPNGSLGTKSDVE